MTALRKFLLSFFIFAVIFLFSPRVVFARVVINEFSSYDSSDWVEIYRTKTENLSLYYLEDAVGNIKQLSWDDCKGEFCTVDWYNKLNKEGDIIKLFLLVYPFPEDQVAYGNMGSDVMAPGVNQSAGRSTDEASSWVIFSTPTEGGSNDTATLVPTVTLIPTLCPTPTSTPSSSSISTPTPLPTTNLIPTLTFVPKLPNPNPTATYKINEVKDEDGEVLSSVKVYVDGVYIHHYAPEVLTFCDGCQCDSYVACGLGQHTIKLEKTGYEDWSKEITINPNASDEVNPVMIFSEPNPTPTPIVLIKPTPTPTQKISPTPTPKKSNQTATDSGEILGEEVSTISAFYPYEATDEAEKNEATPSVRNKILPKIFLIGGLLLLFVSASWLWYTFKYTS